MASSFHFYADIFTNLSNALTTYISDVATNMISAITPVATTLATIYVILWGLLVLRGQTTEIVIDGVFRVLKATLILAFALNLGRYNGYIVDLFWNSPDSLAGYVAGSYGNSTTCMQFLDQLISQVYDFGNVYWTAAHLNTTMGIPDIGGMIVAFLIWGFGGAVTAYGAFLLALAKMALAILLAVGPLFVLLILFEVTKRFFDAWVGQVVIYVVQVMLTAAVIKLMLTIMQKYLNAASSAASATPQFTDILPLVAICFISTLLLRQVTTISSAFGSGFAVSTIGAVGYAYRRATAAFSGTLGMIRPTNAQKSYENTQKELSLIRATYRKIRGIKENTTSKS